jgi:hypothetical protein
MSNDVTSQLSPSNTLGSVNYYPVSSGNPTTTVATTMNYTEPTYLATAGVNTQIDSIGTRMFPLSGLKDTVFAVNKDLWFPTDTFLRMTLGVGNLMAFQSTSATNPTTGAAAISGNITIQNVSLYLAVEQNPDIANNIKETVLSSGLKLLIPYTTGVATNTTSTTGNIQIQLPQNGGKLKKVMHTVWNGTPSGNTALDCANYNGSKISSFTTYMNSNQLQSYTVSCLAPVNGVIGLDDWRENSKFCKDSVVQNRFVYGLNWFNIDNFCEQIIDNDEDNFVDEGLPMNVPQIWSMQATCANTNLTHYTFATFGRQIIIDRNGVTIF